VQPTGGADTIGAASCTSYKSYKLPEGIMTDSVKYLLAESDLPKSWYNIMADLPSPPPPVLHPGTGNPIGPDDLAPLFPMSLILQEVSQERYIDIPEPVRAVYRQWRPSPLYRARRLEQALGTPAKLYYKYEGVSPAGSHKPNTAVAQAFFNKEAGVKRIATETGAGQWGSALAFAGALFGIDVTVFMVRVSYNQKPYRRALMETYGAKCIASPSNQTQYGRSLLEKDPNNMGSLGIAISEAVEVAATREDTKYSLGSVLNHVLMHQSVIGIEAMKRIRNLNALFRQPSIYRSASEASIVIHETSVLRKLPFLGGLFSALQCLRRLDFAAL
jgi:tryptophan synthase beta chain